MHILKIKKLHKNVKCIQLNFKTKNKKNKAKKIQNIKEQKV